MKRRLIGKMLSITLSAAMAVSMLSVPAYAAETEPEEAVFEESAEEILEVEDSEEDTEEYTEDEYYDEDGSEEAPEEGIADEEDAEAGEFYTGEEPAEDVTVEEVYEDVENLTEFEEILPEEVESVEAEDETETINVKSPGPSQGTYNVTFRLGKPAGCLQEHQWGYIDGYTMQVELGEPVVLYGDEMQIPGYELVGWTYKDAAGKTGKVNTAAAKLPCLATKEGEYAEVTPIWKLGTYTLTYNFNGGTSKSKTKVTYKLDSKTVNRQPLLNYVADPSEEDGFSINTVNPEVTMPGYTFTGWSSYYYDERYYGDDVFRDMELRAQWQAIRYELVLDFEDASLKVGDIWHDDTYSFKNYTIYGWIRNYRPVKEGYTFKGWAAKVKGKDKLFKPADKIVLNTFDIDTDGKYRIKAVWTPDTNKLTYELTGGKISKAPKTFKTGDGTAIPNPSMPGYKFNGWKVWAPIDEYDNMDLVDAVEAGYIKDGKLTELATDDLLLVADWKALHYVITIKNNDGSDLVDADGNVLEMPWRDDVVYDENLDFTSAAYFVENYGALGEGKSVAGFATAPGAKKATYKLNTVYSKFLPKTAEGNSLEVPVTLYVVPQDKVYRISYYAGGNVSKATYTFTAKNVTKDLPIKAVATSKGWKFLGWKAAPGSEEYVVTNVNGYVTAIKADTLANVYLEADFGNENTYTITLLPGASDVKNAEGKTVDPKKGELYKVDGVTNFTYETYDYYIENPGWTRDGYEFGGFYTDSKLTKAAVYTTKLGSGKDTNIKIYTRWMPTEHYITTSDTAVVIRGTDRTEVSQSYIGTSYYFWQRVSYGTKDVTPKAVKATGFVFKGWTIANDLTDVSAIEYTDTTKTYVKKIKKTNKQDVVLMPVFEEISYKVYVNPNGGTYKGSTAKTLVADKVYYKDTLENVYNEVSPYAKRSGYNVNTLSTTKDYKGSIYATYIINENNITRYEKRFYSGFGTKQDASVVLNVIWYAVSPGVPKLYVYGDDVNGDELTLHSDYIPSNGYSRIVFEYSTTSDFSADVQTIIWDKAVRDSGDNYNYPKVKLTYGKNYYIRLRQEVIDSTGDYFAGQWSKTKMVHLTKPEY
ncbi:InlB B-repeat-containing protein [Butyrivibrio sp. DSM 10294]|uniref:InlB B-repeat-containing protein n=1 Tax=Butyrivibrio sp. DSM 10294 TaxID=2972457 RepID=UPI00234ECCEF|nr:InlB B-repeat-containing protein [Butyrivibrio sp. DSM 10294]MDC7294768.1 InlB B-repeat-containing protein [Butyrivibrio sp. DSM 10294]